MAEIHIVPTNDIEDSFIYQNADDYNALYCQEMLYFIRNELTPDIDTDLETVKWIDSHKDEWIDRCKRLRPYE